MSAEGKNMTGVAPEAEWQRQGGKSAKKSPVKGSG